MFISATGIALVFSLTSMQDPTFSQGPEVSDREFKSHQECEEFVNTLAGTDVVDEKFEFEFSSSDGLIFTGGCYTAEELLEKMTLSS